MKAKHVILSLLAACPLMALANPVVVKMNSVSKTMTLTKESGETIDLPDPDNLQYSFELDPGTYKLSAYATDGKTLNGEIMINVKDSVTTQQFTVLTCTAYVSNKNDDGTLWSMDKGDYSLKVTINTREGVPVVQTPGRSTTANRYTFLALNGNSYNVEFEPSDLHKSEGYMSLYRGGTLTANVNVTGAIPVGGDFSITVPDDAELHLGMKFTHFTDFTPVQPDRTESAGGGTTYHFRLANGQVYNYRTWKDGGLTHAGYFTMNVADPSKCPVINFTDADYESHDPKAINHSVSSNNGYETGDLLLNINKEHHLKLKVGEEFLVHGMRMWELTDNSTNNYFFEPDMHYTVLDTDFKPSNKVIEIDNADTHDSAWSKITAKSDGTAIVMVTYDGINLNYYSNAQKKDYLGGEYWGAIWPENTGVFVVTVGEDQSEAVGNMIVNEQYNVGALRLAGKFVDAEHDVFYYLETEEGFPFTFKPEGVVSVDVATPTITETEAVYTGFSSENVSKAADGSYSVLLKEGRNIIRLTDSAGRSSYQVVSAKPCKRVISNETRPGSTIFQPGDRVKIQYSGLFHPANKIAGIYNMSAYVTYNGTPNGSSLILGSGQYTFGSAASAQAVTVDIPADYDVEKNPEWVMDEGVIQVNGYGDPIGNHRNTDFTTGRSPNFTAVPHKTYFGALPEIRISLSTIKSFDIYLSGVPADAKVELSFNGQSISADDEGRYSGTYGKYSLTATAEGYKCFRRDYTVGDDSQQRVVFPVEMELLGDAWDGLSKAEPLMDEEGVYQISSPSELAWFAENINTGGARHNAVLLSDIELGNFAWTPIGNSSKQFTGSFNGNGHAVSEIYVNDNANYKGLFGYVKDASIVGITVSGSVEGKQYVGGLAGLVTGSSIIERCANNCSVAGSGTYVGGVVGHLNSATAVLKNCYNAGDVSGTTNCGGVIGNNNQSAVMENIYNVGIVSGKTVGACVGGTTAKTNLSNAFSIYEYDIVDNHTLVSRETMASGEVAYRLGDAFFQTIGIDDRPMFEGLKVYFDANANEYYNNAVSFEIDPGEGDDEVKVEAGEIVMHVDGSYRLSLIAYPTGSRLPEVEWSSSDSSIVSVNADGMITAVGLGQTTIKAVAEIDGREVVSCCNVNVISAFDEVLLIDSKKAEQTVDVYDLAGRIVKLKATLGDCRSLAPGLYIIKYEDKVEKVRL